MSDLHDHHGFNLSTFIAELTPYEQRCLNIIDCGHYFCMVWRCLRFYLGLRRSTVHIANLMSVLQTGVNTPERRNIYLWSQMLLEGQSLIRMTPSHLLSLLQYQDHLYQTVIEMTKSLKFLDRQLRELQNQFQRLGLKIKVPERESLGVMALRGINPQLIS